MPVSCTMSPMPIYNECIQSSFPDHTFAADKPKQTPAPGEFHPGLIEDPGSAIHIPFDMESFESNLFLSPFFTSNLLYDAVPEAATPSTLPSNEASPSYVTDDLSLPAYSSRSSPSPDTPAVYMSEVENEPPLPSPTMENTPKRSPSKGTVHSPEIR